VGQFRTRDSVGGTPTDAVETTALPEKVANDWGDQSMRLNVLGCGSHSSLVFPCCFESALPGSSRIGDVNFVLSINKAEVVYQMEALWIMNDGRVSDSVGRLVSTNEPAAAS
jgi:hypothetical protein